MSLNSDLLFIDDHFSRPPNTDLAKDVAGQLVKRLISAADSLGELKSHEDLAGLSSDFLKSAIALLIGSIMGASIPQNDGA